MKMLQTLKHFSPFFSHSMKKSIVRTFDKYLVVTGTLILFLCFFLPSHGFADVEFSITNTQIDALLQEDGSVMVHEEHTYEFDGNFNGITRGLITKEGTKIVNFEASENGETLKTEKDGSTYKVHRKGEDERVTIKLSYLIQDGVELFPDVAQFYWPFFDKSNESTYENLSVTVHPPKETKHVIAFGYDEAFGTEATQPDGTVVFNFGEVPSGNNGDIRVAYDSKFFPSAPLTSEKPMQEEILKEQQDGINQAIKRAESREFFSKIAWVAIPVATMILFALMFQNWLKGNSRKKAVMSEEPLSYPIPKQLMSLPATVYFTNFSQLPSEAMAAALLDLVRQGYVKRYPDHYFHLENRQGALKHEEILIELLFDEIGEHGDFSFDMLKTYTKKTKNHQTYLDYQMKWKQAIKEEVDSHNLYENKTNYRMVFGFSSLFLLPLLFLLPYYQLLGWFFATIVLFITVITYAITYRPKTVEGVRISHEWSMFKQKFKQITPNEWSSWSEDEQMRAFIYGLGINEKELRKKNDDLVEAFTKPTNVGGFYSSDSYTGTTDVYSFAYMANSLSSNFHSANQTVDSSTSSTSSGGGSGAGGGGGGSGAF